MSEGPAGAPLGGEARPLGSNYLLDALLGTDHLGERWSGRDRRSGRPVTVRVVDLRPEAGGVSLRELVRRRIELVRLRHPNVVRVLDVVVEGERGAVVYEPNAAPSLDEALRIDGPLTQDAVGQVARSCLSALASLHGVGLVHGDLRLGAVSVWFEGDEVRVLIGDAGLGPDGARPEEDVRALATVLAEAGGGTLPAPLDAVVRDMSARDPTLRPKAAESLEALTHPPPVAVPEENARPVAGTSTEAGVTTLVPRRRHRSQPPPEPPGAVAAGVPSRGGSRRRLPLLLGLVACLVGAIVAGVLFLRGGDGGAPAWLAARPAAYENGLVVGRSWEFVDGDTVAVKLTYVNTGDGSVELEEHVPRAVAPADQGLPDGVEHLEGGRLLRITPGLDPGEQRVVRYRVDGVDDDGDPQVFLGEVAAELERIDDSAEQRLESAVIRPSRLDLVDGERARVALAGTVDGGGTAPPALLELLEWRSSDDDVATMGEGVVVAGSSGEAVLTSRFGSSEVRLPVSVDGGSAAAGAGICEPGSGEAQGLSALPDGTFIRDDEGDVYAVNGGGRIGVPSDLAFSALRVPEEDLLRRSNEERADIPNIPQNGTLLREPNGRMVIVLGGRPFDVQDEAAARRLGYDDREANLVPEGTIGKLRDLPVPRTLLRRVGTAEVYVSDGRRMAPTEELCANATVLDAPADADLGP